MINALRIGFFLAGSQTTPQARMITLKPRCRSERLWRPLKPLPWFVSGWEHHTSGQGTHGPPRALLAIFAIPAILQSKGKVLEMATMNVSLPDQMKSWVENQTEDGRFGNASDYVRHLIRKDQERQEALAALQAEITAGLQSGKPKPFDAARFKAEMRDRHGS